MRQRRPAVVILENVADPRAVGPMTGLLLRMGQGYTLEGGVLNPEEVAGAPTSRERHFWVMIRCDGGELA